MVQGLLKVILLLPLIALVLAGLVLLTALPQAWGVAQQARLADWAPPFGGLIIACMATLAGALGLRASWQRMRHDIFIAPFYQAFAYFFMSGAALLTLVLATRIGDPASYESFIDDRGEPNTSTAGFLFVSLGGSMVIALMLWACAYVYVQGINPAGSRRFERSEDEPDGVADLLRGRRSSRNAKPPG